MRRATDLEAQFSRAREGLQRLLRAIAAGRRLGLAQDDLQPQFLIFARRAVWESGDEFDALLRVRPGLIHRRARQGLLAGSIKIADRLFRLSGFGAVIRQLLRLALDDIRKFFLQRRNNAAVNQMLLAAQQCAVGGLLHQSVLECIFGVGRRAAPEQQLGADELLEGVVELLRGASARRR